jgi:putative ABC transport system permease protein
MIWSLAWRNVWRNKLRSAVVIIAVALGLFAGVFSTALMKGMSDKRAEDAIHTEISHIQIHKKGFLLNSDVSLYMDNVDEMLEEIRINGACGRGNKKDFANADGRNNRDNAGANINSCGHI